MPFQQKAHFVQRYRCRLCLPFDVKWRNSCFRFVYSIDYTRVSSKHNFQVCARCIFFLDISFLSFILPPYFVAKLLTVCWSCFVFIVLSFRNLDGVEVEPFYFRLRRIRSSEKRNVREIPMNVRSIISCISSSSSITQSEHCRHRRRRRWRRRHRRRPPNSVCALDLSKHNFAADDHFPHLPIRSSFLSHWNKKKTFVSLSSYSVTKSVATAIVTAIFPPKNEKQH